MSFTLEAFKMVFTKLECAFVMKKEEKKRQKEEEEKDIWIKANIFFVKRLKLIYVLFFAGHVSF